MKNLMLSLLCFFCLIILTCNTEKKKESTTTTVKTSTSIDTINIIHDTFPVCIDVKGFPAYWKEQTIYAHDSSQIISILVDEHQNVSRNDYLLSLWQLDNSNEYTPVDIKAPFSGIVGKIFVKIGSRVKEKTPLLYLYNDQFYLMNVKLSVEQLSYIKKGQKVVSQEINGYVESIDRNNNNAKIIFKNENILINKYNTIHVNIMCGNIRGDFVLSRYFDKDKNLIAYIDDESSFKITQIGYSDSLSLISPQLPHLSKLSIIYHNN